jgi:hypothetical protein
VSGAEPISALTSLLNELFEPIKFRDSDCLIKKKVNHGYIYEERVPTYPAIERTRLCVTRNGDAIVKLLIKVIVFSRPLFNL